MQGFRHFAQESNTNQTYELCGLVDELADIGSSAIPLLVDALDDSNTDVRASAVSALGRLGNGDPTVCDGLAERLLQDSDVSVRRSAAAALGVLDPLPYSADRALQRALLDIDDEVTEFASMCLAQLNLHKQAQRLRRQLYLGQRVCPIKLKPQPQLHFKPHYSAGSIEKNPA